MAGVVWQEATKVDRASILRPPLSKHVFVIKSVQGHHLAV